jgi:Big-like domain-containing protein/putative Ig domain-containing protein/VCBS repeat protein
MTLSSHLASAADLVPCFLPAEVVVEEDVYTIAAGDFNGDQRNDLALTLSVRGSVGVLLSDGAGGFGKLTEFPVGSQPAAVVSADFNKDSHLDLAVTYSTQVAILLGNGAGGFVPGSILPGGLGPNALAVGEFNADGNLDLAVGDTASILILLGDGTGAFVGPTSYPMANRTIFSIAVADFNLDTRQDLVTQLDFPGQIVVLLGLGNGAFGSPRYFAAGAVPVSVGVGHFNADSRPDVVVANEGGPSVSILFGDGGGGFGPPIGFGSGPGARSVAVDDFNWDQHYDVAVTNEYENSILVFAGDGAGSLTGPFRSPAGLHPRELEGVHLDPDGRPDLVVANERSASVVRNGLTLSPPPFGILPNGTVGIPFPSTSFLVAGGTPPYAFSATGALPAGILLSPAGTLSGTPTQAGEAYFLVTARSTEGCSATGSYRLLVARAATSVQVSSSVNPALPGQTVMLSATVSALPPSSGTPTGMVIFRADSGAALGSVPLKGVIATLSLSDLPPGTTVISVTYEGDANFLASAAAAFSQGVVGPAIPTLEPAVLLALALLLTAAGVVLARNAG